MLQLQKYQTNTSINNFRRTILGISKNTRSVLEPEICVCFSSFCCVRKYQNNTSINNFMRTILGIYKNTRSGLEPKKSVIFCHAFCKTSDLFFAFACGSNFKSDWIARNKTSYEKGIKCNVLFSNFSCVFLNPNNFFQFEL